MAYYVRLIKVRRNEPMKDPHSWYKGGHHVFDTLNAARKDAIEMYKRGWHEGTTGLIAEIFGTFNVQKIQAVHIHRSLDAPPVGAVVKYRNRFYWAENKKHGKKYELNMNGTLRAVKSDQKEWDFGVKGDWRPFQG